MIRAVIFDNDGVVINSEPIIFEATAKVFKKYGITIAKEDVEDGIGAGAKYVSLAQNKHGLTDVPLDVLMFEREANFRDLALGRLKPLPELFQVMKYLKERKVLSALASSAATEVVYHNLKIAHIDHRLFDVVVDSSKIKNKKPNPDIFLEAAQLLKVTPSDCLVIEDAPAGIEAAKRAHMQVIALANSLPKEKLKDADVVLDSMAELIDLMKKLEL